MTSVIVRKASKWDEEVIAQIESSCFPQEEAATKEQIQKRMKVFGNHFYVIDYLGNVIGFINGMVTDEETISDVMYEEEKMHNESGAWQSVFGIDVLAQFRHQGYATMLMNEFIKQAKKEHRKGVILTCKEHLIPFYEGFGYVNQGISNSVHGGAEWYDMKLSFLNKK